MNWIKMYRLLVMLLVSVSLIEAIIAPEDEVTKPPRHRENLQWPPDHPNYTPVRVQTSVKVEPREKYRDVVLVNRQSGSELCPDKATGQFTYLPDCRKFINCWKGRGFIQACAPGTLFNPRSLECDFPAKVKCLPYEEEGKSEAIKEETGEANEELDYVGKGMIDVRFGTEFESTSNSSSEDLPEGSFIPSGQPSLKHNSRGSGRSYPISDTNISKSLPNRPPSTARPNSYPSSGYHPSNPPQYQGRFPPRQPHSSSAGNPHQPPYNPPYSSQHHSAQSSGSSVVSQTSPYNPSYPQPSAPQLPGSQQQHFQPSRNPHLLQPPPNNVQPHNHPQSSGTPSLYLQPPPPPPLSPFPESQQNYPRPPTPLPPGHDLSYSPSEYHNSQQYQPGQRAPGRQQYSGQGPPGQQNHPEQRPAGHQHYSGQGPPGQQHQSGQKPPGHQQYSGQMPPGQQNYPEQRPAGHQHYSGQGPPGQQHQSGQRPPGHQQYPYQEPPGQRPPGHQQYSGQGQPGQQHHPGQRPPGHQQYPYQEPPGQQHHPGQRPSSHQHYPGQGSPGQQHHPGQRSPGHQQYPTPYIPYLEQNPARPQNPSESYNQPQYPHTQHGSQQYPGSYSTSSQAPHGGHNKTDCNMPGGTGVAPHPTDCRKYLDCWKGYPYPRFCAPGTLFNPVLLQCDHPFNVNCKKGTNEDPGKKWVPPKELPHPTTPHSGLTDVPASGFRPYQPGSDIPDPYRPVGFSPVNQSNPSLHKPSGPNAPVHPTLRPPSAYSPISTEHTDRLDFSLQESQGLYPGLSHSQTSKTTPQPLLRTSTHHTVTTREPSFTSEESHINTHFVAGPESWQPEGGSSWVSESDSVENKASTVRPAISTQTPRPTTIKPSYNIYVTTSATTTKKPTNIMSISNSSNTQSKPTLKPTTRRPVVRYIPSVMTSGQVLRLRGGQGPFDGYVEVQGSTPGWGLVCDESGGWTVDEATVVCKQLGYTRGAELSWQGRPVRPTDDTIHVSVSEVKCSGDEKDFFACRMTRGAGHCLIPRDAVGVRCYRNYVSSCQEGEINHRGKCYSVIVPKEDTALEAFSHGEALADCQRRKGKLLDITSQAESDFISELLLQSYPHINSIITSGIGVKVMGHPLWIWEGSGETFLFQKWWPGWTGNATIPTATTSGERMNCVVAKRVFPCQAPYLPDVVGVANLCEANYFYWATEDCSVTHDHPYVCERPVDDVGCVNNAGQDYMGTANISSTGSPCLPWDSPLTPSALKYRMAYKVRQRTMVGHNYCRNVAGGETHPWCYVGPEAQFQYCDIPECQTEGEDTTVTTPVSNTNICGNQEFTCRPGECVASSLVCDKNLDCSNGKDEDDCPSTGDFSIKCAKNQFQCKSGECIPLSWACEGSPDCKDGSDEDSCPGKDSSIRCDEDNFLCKSGRCIPSTQLCDGSRDCSDGSDEEYCPVIGSVPGSSVKCSKNEFGCKNGECIPSAWVCDGSRDCRDGSDEDNNCPDVEKAVRDGLKCGPKEFECRPGECVLLTWVCDGAKDCSNGRDEKDCSGVLGEFSKHLNRRLVKHDKQKWLESDATMCAEHCMKAKDFTCRSFNHLPKDRICILSDSNVGLSGDLNQTVGWHYYERKSTSLQCDNLFRCDNGKCVNRSMICDGKNNCGDRTDERNCSAEYLDFGIRLVGGNASNEGRVEVKVFGEWGAICDDLFGPRDAEVVCRELNFTLGAAEVVGQSLFGGSSSKYLVDDLQCRGDENSIRECDFDGWGVHDCGPEEAAGVVCRVPGVDCKVNYWRCDKSSECIPIGFLCDNVPDCEDGSDESAAHCEAPVELRLAGGPNNMSGRVEVRYNGVWGTVCDDDFTDTAAQVICRMLGFGGPAEAKKDAAFGPGEGQIWVDQLHCTGKETHIEDCIHSQWGENNCAHEEDASVICSAGEVPKNTIDRYKPRVVGTITVSPDVMVNQLLPAHCGLKADEYWEMATRTEDRVIGGNEVVQGSFPWQASVRVRTAGKSVHWCGAVVLSPLHILTAGHCLQDYTKGAYLVRVGDHDTEANDGSEQEASIDEIYVHEGFNKGPRLNNDIALVKLKSGGIRLGHDVQPICLPPSNIRYHSGLNCSISGWGTSKAGGTGYARKLRAAWVSVIPDEVCRADYVYGSKAITAGMICAGDLEGTADSCQGDSGGPLICLNNGRFTLFGITSWGHGCGRPNRPGVYSNIGYFRSWIDQKLKDSMTGK